MKRTKPEGKGFSRSTLLIFLFLFLWVEGLMLFIIFPETTIRISFINVIHYVDQDSRNSNHIIYAEPTINRSGSWTITEFHWWQHNHVDWEQINAFLTTLSREDGSVRWCKDYAIDNEFGPQYRWLIWYEDSDGTHSFLFCYNRNFLDYLHFTMTNIMILIISAIVLILAFKLANIR